MPLRNLLRARPIVRREVPSIASIAIQQQEGFEWRFLIGVTIVILEAPFSISEFRSTKLPRLTLDIAGSAVF